MYESPAEMLSERMSEFHISIFTHICADVCTYLYIYIYIHTLFIIVNTCFYLDKLDLFKKNA